MQMDWQALGSALRNIGLDVPTTAGVRPVAGGDTAGAWQVDARPAALFLKCMASADAGLLRAEAEGLKALAATGALRVPEVLGVGEAGASAFLALEWIDFTARAGVDAELGVRLAQLHRHTGEGFGWPHDNWLGRGVQLNGPHESWPDWFATWRLGVQYERAYANGFAEALSPLRGPLFAAVPRVFAGYAPQPSLIHGDLWGGNWAAAAGGPVVFDPAVHYADRECDLAMAALFGGFDASFFAAYADAWPLADGVAPRRALYQLYHLLNHLNLFGSAYLAGVQAKIHEVLSS